MIEIVKYYIPDEYAIEEFEELNYDNEDMEFDDIYLGDYQKFVIFNKTTGKIIKEGDTGHINLSNFISGLEAGLMSSGIKYGIVGKVISEDEWEEVKKNYIIKFE